MLGLSRATTLYIAAMAALTLAMAAGALRDASPPSARQFVLALILVASAAAAVAFPFEFIPQTKLAFDTSVIIASILLFPPGPAMLIVGTGVFLGQVLRRLPAAQILFNTCHTMLQCGIGGLVLRRAGWQFGRFEFTGAQQVVGVGLAIIAVYFFATVGVAAIIALHSDQSPIRVAAQLSRAAYIEIPVQVPLGLLIVVVATTHIWALVLLLPLVYAVYQASRRYLPAFHTAAVRESPGGEQTTLANRQVLLERLERALAQTARSRRPLAVLWIEIDQIEDIEEALGQQGSHQALEVVADRLLAMLRDTDTLARVGGSDFVILLCDLKGVEEAALLSDEVARSLSEPMSIADRDVVLSINVGMAISETGTETPDDLLRAADRAMYRAKLEASTTSIAAAQALDDQQQHPTPPRGVTPIRRR